MILAVFTVLGVMHDSMAFSRWPLITDWNMVAIRAYISCQEMTAGWPCFLAGDKGVSLDMEWFL